MKTSIILSCYNEIRHGYLAAILENLSHQQGESEIIAVVSPSQDQTLDLLQQYPQAHIITAPACGRAKRYDLGLAACTGDFILLHHSATLLPPQIALTQIAQVLANPNQIWGGFHHSFDYDHWLLQFTSWYSNQVRGKQKGILYFDHCIFAKRQTLIDLGGIPDLHIFADTRLSEQLRQLSYPEFCPGRVITSARRFRTRGIYGQAILNQALKLLYHLGISDRALNRIYEQNQSINVPYIHSR
ncbi:MAG: glycosyltransferase [Pseudanabaenaceae cyanobacterium bins.68]|nr:glycosyltransferase [Pseudanabaenaceae cyanobacterium bins.68]